MNIHEFENEINKSNTCFLCGNGLSMNFDSSFSNIHMRLFDAHKSLYENTKFEVNSKNNKLNRKLTENYNSVINSLKDIAKEDFYKIFDDGILFAESIIQCKGMEDKLKEEGYLNYLVFGASQWSSLSSLYKVGIEEGVEKVNIEYWTILIYFYFAMIKLKPVNYSLPINNSFIDIIEKGNVSNIQIGIEHDLTIVTSLNGFNTYYKMLYSSAIYNSGKAIDINKLDKVGDLNIREINFFLSKFNIILTLNYDLIIECILKSRTVYHLHGKFIPNNKEYVFYQSYSIKDSKDIISCSDILIGDYFVNKIFFAITAKSASAKFPNKKLMLASDIINESFINNSISQIIIFGMNIINDQDILRYIMIAFYDAKILEPHIIYCYFNKEEKIEFDKQFSDVITFNKDLSNYSKSIKVSYMSTKDILNEYFVN